MKMAAPCIIYVWGSVSVEVGVNGGVLKVERRKKTVHLANEKGVDASTNAVV
ncbi:hypothetical protein LguiA_003090 [Lonicera macranthoides]